MDHQFSEIKFQVQIHQKFLIRYKILSNSAKLSSCSIILTFSVNKGYSLISVFNLLTSTEITVSESLKFMILLSILNMVSLFGSGQRFFNLVDLSNLGLGLCGY